MGLLAPFWKVGHTVWVGVSVVEACLTICRWKEVDVDVNLMGRIRDHFDQSVVVRRLSEVRLAQ